MLTAVVHQTMQVIVVITVYIATAVAYLTHIFFCQTSVRVVGVKILNIFADAVIPQRQILFPAGW